MIAPHFERFCSTWLSKAEQCDVDSTDGCYDKFFTLFVVFNRLYAEATFELARRGEISIQPNRPLPDRKGATEYTLLFVGQAAMDQPLQNELAGVIEELTGLIEAESFYIKLSNPNGERQREKDLDLLQRLRARGKTKALAVLDLLYSIRCNLFHGHKAFDPVQVELLRPSIELLSAVIRALWHSHGMHVAYPFSLGDGHKLASPTSGRPLPRTLEPSHQ